MAARYWVGGTGNWNDTAKWSTTSGGAGGASIPVAADTVTYDVNSDAGVDFAVTIPTGVAAVCASITVTGVTNNITITFVGTATLNVSGGLSIGSAGVAGTGILFSGSTTTSCVFGGTISHFSRFGLVGNAGLTALNYSATSNLNIRILEMGSGGTIKLTQTGTTTPWSIVVSGGGHTNNGTGTVEFSGALASATTRTITHAGTTPENVSFKVSGGLSGSFTTFTAGTIGSLDFTGYAGSWTTTTLTITGSLTLNTTMAVTGSATLTFAGTGTITSAGKTLSNPIIIASATTTLGDALTTSGTFTLTSGTINLVSYNLSCLTFSSSNSNTRSILMGTGTVTLSGTGTVWNVATTTGLTFTKSSANIVLSNTTTTARTFAGGGLTYNNLTIGGTTGISTTTITGSNTFATFASTKTVAHSILFTGGTTNTFAAFTVTGTSGNVVTLGAVSGTCALALTTSTAFQMNFMSISNVTATPTPNIWYAVNSNNGGGNTGITFAARLLYWTGGTGTWDSSTTTNWSLTSGGASAGVAPSIDTDVYFDVNSNVTTGTFTVTMSTGATCRSFVASGLDGTMTLAGTAAWSIGGSLTFPTTNFTRTYTGAITFTSATANTITTSGNTLASVITFNGTGSWTLGSALTTTGTSVTLTAGTLALSSYTLTTPIFLTTNSNIRTLDFGTGKIVLNAATASTIWNMSTATNATVTGSRLVEIITTGTGTKDISMESVTEDKALDFSLLTIAAVSNNEISFYNARNVRSLTVSATSVIQWFISGSVTVYGNLDILGIISAHSNIVNMTSTSGSWYLNILTSSLYSLQISITGNVQVNNLTLGSFGGTGSLTVNSGSVQLNNNVNIPGNLVVNGGTFNANNYTVTTSRFSSSNTTIRSILMGTGTWTLTGTATVWSLATTTNLTFTKSTANIVLSNTSTTARTFAGGGLTYNNLTIGGATGTSTLTLTGSNTFNTLASTKTVAHTILFTGGTTTTFTSFTVTGTAGNVVTIGSTNTTQATIAKPTAWYVGGNSINGGNNTNLLFGGGNNLDYLNLSYINGSPEVLPSASFFMFCV